MILAAGLGTRLRPLTHRIPKPLIEVGGVPMLERVALRLVAAGADRLIVNVHHLGGQVAAFLEERKGFGAEVRVSYEEGDAPLETGGGVRHAAPHFRRQGPFFLHNSDVLTDLPLEELHRAHLEGEAPLATLAVMDRETSRHLLFDEEGLVGWANTDTGRTVRARPPRGGESRLAFSGVHVVSDRFLDLCTEEGAFSIFDPYLRLVGEGEVIRPFRMDGCDWIDIGRPEELVRARQAIAGR